MADPSTDPRGFLDAAPELERFTTDPGVAAALARGDATALRAALAQRRRMKKGPGEERVIDGILAKRRLFLEPISSAPGLFTLNGFGTRLYGRADAAADGTYVGTHFLTALFLPIWPLAQYLVASQGSKYQFYGKVPLSKAMKGWRGVVGAAVLAALAAGGVGSWSAGRTSNVHLLNGLPVVVVVEVAGQRQVLPALEGHRVVELATGKQHVRASTQEERVLEELDVEVPSRTALVAYNVLGAAPLVVEEVFYGPADSASRRNLRASLLAGASFATEDHVDYLFLPPPQKLQVPDRGATRTRAWIPDGGWAASLGGLVGDGRAPDAARLAIAALRAVPSSGEVYDAARRLAYVDRGMAGTLEAAEALLAEDEGSVEGHRTRQHALAALGRGDEARRIYRELEAQHPDSPLHAYLRARAEMGAEGARLLDAALRRFPEDANLLRAVAWNQYEAERYGEALATWAHLGRVDPEKLEDLLPIRAESLVRAGRAREAAALVAARAEAGPDIRTALLHARVARLVRAPKHPPRHYLDRLEKVLPAGDLAFLRVAEATVLGASPPAANTLGAIEDKAARAGLRLGIAALGDPAAAAPLLAKAGRAELDYVSDVLLLAVGAEVARTDPALVAPIVGEIDGVHGLGELVVRFVRGEDPPELAELLPEHKTALLLGRARALEAAGKDARAVYVEIKRREAMPGTVSVLLAWWPKAAGR